MSARTLYVLRAAVPLLAAVTVVGCTPGQDQPSAGDPSASSTANPGDAVPPAQLPADSPLGAGRYVVSVADAPSASPLPVLSVPEGYEAIGGGIGVGADHLARYLWVWDVKSVFAHPCDASPVPVGPSVADLAEALTNQSLRAGTDPHAVTVGGYDGLYVELSVPDAVDASACPSGVFSLWPGRAERYQDVLGQVDMVWIVDVDGQRLVFDAAHLPDASADEVAELEEMVSTATFTPAEGS
ncbi:MAG: hypothetical protein JWQ99_2743 [Blastococcus sp.]|nr:hypothetical protein [Blastococcus sp.]